VGVERKSEGAWEEGALAGGAWRGWSRRAMNYGA